jgi:hypothetical protein
LLMSESEAPRAAEHLTKSEHLTIYSEVLFIVWY